MLQLKFYPIFCNFVSYIHSDWILWQSLSYSLVIIMFLYPYAEISEKMKFSLEKINLFIFTNHHSLWYNFTLSNWKSSLYCNWNTHWGCLIYVSFVIWIKLKDIRHFNHVYENSHCSLFKVMYNIVNIVYRYLFVDLCQI